MSLRSLCVMRVYWGPTSRTEAGHLPARLTEKAIKALAEKEKLICYTYEDVFLTFDEICVYFDSSKVVKESL